MLGTSQSDTTTPTVTLTAPANNATLSGSVNITADATDNIAVAGVSFFANGVLIGSEDTTAPYSVSWNTSSNPNGSYVLTAVARDSSGNQTTSSSRTVSIQNNASTLGLVAQWSFDDGSGTTAQDDSGNGHAGAISNTTWSTTGKYGGALTFNGTNSWVAVADAASLDLTTGMTIEAWVNPTSLTGWRRSLSRSEQGDCPIRFMRRILNSVQHHRPRSSISEQPTIPPLQERKPYRSIRGPTSLEHTTVRS